MMAPLWIMGPSLPTGSPAETLKTMPTALATRVLKPTTFFMCTPLR